MHDTQSAVKVQGQRSRSQRDITYQCGKNAIIQTLISCWRSNSVKIISEPSATHVTRRSRSLGQIFWNCNNLPQIARLRLKFHQITSDTLHMFKIKDQMSRSQGQRSGSQCKVMCKVMYQQQKCYNTAMDRFSDFKLGMAS